MRSIIFRRVAMGAFVAATLTTGAQTANAQDYARQSCGQLWHARNSVFADYGHCFKTPQAISAFGKACFPPFGKLPASAQAVVNEIISWERRKGCTG